MSTTFMIDRAHALVTVPSCPYARDYTRSTWIQLSPSAVETGAFVPAAEKDLSPVPAHAQKALAVWTATLATLEKTARLYYYAVDRYMPFTAVARHYDRGLFDARAIRVYPRVDFSISPHGYVSYACSEHVPAHGDTVGGYGKRVPWTTLNPSALCLIQSLLND